MKIWFLVPARSGSKGIPKKNLRNLGSKPLISHIVETLFSFSSQESIIVSTDDESIKVLLNDKCTIHNRSLDNADDSATLDDVALEVTKYLLENGASESDILITCQPTSPFLSESTIREVIRLHKKENIETVISVKDDRHLRWTFKNEQAIPYYLKRVNRQQLPPVFSETGGVISSALGRIVKTGSRIGEKISLVTLDEREGLDIDTFTDWALAEYWVNRKKIIIRVDGSKTLGFGHLYRALAIAQSIHAHSISFVTRSDGEYSLGINFLRRFNYPVLEIASNEEFLDKLHEIKPDIVINDILDTTVDYITTLKNQGCFVANFEDLGKGNILADIVINDLYPDLLPKKNHWYGVEHAILNPNFEDIKRRKEPQKEVNHILIACGGTDPSNLTGKAIRALEFVDFNKEVSVILGPGNMHFDNIQKILGNIKGKVNLLHNVDNMAEVMINSDLAITSAGRTVTELMVAGVPTIAMCQNPREMRHNHASSTYGVINLGLGSHISPEVLAEHLRHFINDESLRKEMYSRMSKAIKHRSNQRIIDKIMNVYNSKES
jgi:UDP-2,4-diacetamido-2,4,6-trideoxy-beta-L-altropyranose hydrolase